MEGKEFLEECFSIVLNSEEDSHKDNILKPILKEAFDIILYEFFEDKLEFASINNIKIDASNKRIDLTLDNLNDNLLELLNNDLFKLINSFNDFIYQKLECRVIHYKKDRLSRGKGNYCLNIDLKY